MIHYYLLKDIFMIFSMVISTILGIMLIDYQDLKEEMKENIEYYGNSEKTTFRNKSILRKIKRYKKKIFILIIILTICFSLFLFWR